MCRIAGIIDKNSSTLTSDIIAMRDCMKHGGPDDDGVYYDANADLALGHRRLSIIDLSSGGHQPMCSSDDEVIVVYNGEIYNYLDLKADLQTLGYGFKTASDTEVIINAYLCWGVDCFMKLKGMFAIALYDKGKSELILARDQSGIKPIYYSINDTSLYFASEIKAFGAVSRQWLQSEEWKIYFLTYGYLPEPITTLRDVKPLPKGNYLRINVNNLRYVQREYATDVYSDDIDNEQEALQLIKEKLNKAVDRHLISDAQIGLFLSGGIDSSLLTLIANRSGHKDLHTLSIVFDDENYSEKQYQDIIAQQVASHHKAYSLTKNIFVDAIPDIFKAMDQPTSDGVNTYFICKFAKQYGLKAVLSGLGADELFGGYASFNRGRIISKFSRIPSGLIGLTSYLHKDKYRKISFLSRKDVVGEYLFNRGFFSVTETAAILDTTVKEVEAKLNDIAVPEFVQYLPYGNRVSYMERNMYMQNQLLKDTDMMSMWHSVEVRVPFLDVDVIAAANSISPQLKFNRNRPKYLLVESYKDILPKEVWDRPKQGFVFPFKKWMKGNETKCIGDINVAMMKKYDTGKINWSRYWTYMVASRYSTLN